MHKKSLHSALEPASNPAANLARLFPGNTQMAQLMRAFNWPATPLGPAEYWPQSLKTALGILLNSQFATWLGWGPECVLFYNDSCMTGLGNFHPGALGRPAEFAFAEAWEQVHPITRAVLSGETVTLNNRPWTYKRHDRLVTMFFNSYYSPVPDETGAVAGVMAAHFETTAQIKAEAEHRHSEQRLKAALTAGRMAAWDWDPSIDQVTWSSGVADVFGLPPGEQLRSSAQGFTLVHPNDRERHRDIVQGASKRCDSFHSEFRIVRPRDGEIAWLEERGTATCTPETDAIRLSGLVWDVTERKRAEAQLRESEERFRRATEIETVGIIFFRTDGRITGANPAFLQMSGYSPEDVASGLVRWDLMTPPEWMPASRKAIEEFKSLGQTVPYEKEYIRKDGSRWWALFAAKRLREDEGVEYIIDIAERKKAEQTQRLLLSELNHRAKNTLATVQAIASQTLRLSVSPSEFVDSFNGRLQALARAHSLLTKSKWEGAQLADIFRDQLTLGECAERVFCSGPPAFLPSQPALHLALVLHELGTNARKYGALSVPRGSVLATWTVESSGTGLHLKLDWAERDGPPVKEPHKTGFGTVLLTHSLRGVGGKTSICFDPSGFSCSVHLPLGADDKRSSASTAAQA